MNENATLALANRRVQRLKKSLQRQQSGSMDPPSCLGIHTEAGKEHKRVLISTGISWRCQSTLKATCCGDTR